MAPRQSSSSRCDRTSRPRSKSRFNSQSRNRALHLEPCEQRTLMAVGPEILAVIPSVNTILNDGGMLNTAPTELTVRFTSAMDPNTLTGGGQSNIRVTRAGGDGILNNANDVSV